MELAQASWLLDRYYRTAGKQPQADRRASGISPVQLAIGLSPATIQVKTTGKAKNSFYKNIFYYG
jgi:hypothetical protein